MKTQVLTVSNTEPTQPYYHYKEYLASLRRFGVEPTVLGMGEPWGGLMTKERHYRKWLREGNAQCDTLIISDAWDILFAVPPDELADVYEANYPTRPIVFNAEKACFPRLDLADQFPDPGTPWRYFNGGFIMGEPANILKMLEAMNLDAIPDDHQRPDGSWFHSNDQEHLTLVFLAQPVPMVLDVRCELCQSFSSALYEEFAFEGEKIKNLITGSTVRVGHFNGDAKNLIFPKFKANIGL